MSPELLRIVAVSLTALIGAGCAMQPRAPGSINPLCALAGAVVGGGTAAAITIAAGPIGGGVLAGAMIGSIACADSTPVPPQPLAVATTTPPPAPTVQPALDSDGDGVPDNLDRCPNTAIGQKVDANGCPDILLTLTGVNFKFDSARIEPNSEALLDQAVTALKDSSSVAVRIEGHTDSVGTEAYNLLLSQRRAKAVEDYLIAHGIVGARLTTEGKGESVPVAPNETAAGRYQNRRVEFHVVGDKSVSATGDGAGDHMPSASMQSDAQTNAQYRQ